MCRPDGGEDAQASPVRPAPHSCRARRSVPVSSSEKASDRPRNRMPTFPANATPHLHPRTHPAKDAALLRCTRHQAKHQPRRSHPLLGCRRVERARADRARAERASRSRATQAAQRSGRAHPGELSQPMCFELCLVNRVLTSCCCGLQAFYRGRRAASDVRASYRLQFDQLVKAASTQAGQLTLEQSLALTRLLGFSLVDGNAGDLKRGASWARLMLSPALSTPATETPALFALFKGPDAGRYLVLVRKVAHAFLLQAAARPS